MGSVVGLDDGVLGLVLGVAVRVESEVTFGLLDPATVGLGVASGVDGRVRNQVILAAMAATSAVMAMSHFGVFRKTVTPRNVVEPFVVA